MTAEGIRAAVPIGIATTTFDGASGVANMPTQDLLALAEAQLSSSSGAITLSTLLGTSHAAAAVAAAAVTTPAPLAAGTMMPSATGRTNGLPVPGRIFLTKVAPGITRNDLQAYFQQFGKLTDCYVPANKGIAFVSYEDPSVAERVLANREHIVKAGQTAVLAEQAIDRSQFPSFGGPPKGVFPGGQVAAASGSCQGRAAVPGRVFVTHVHTDISRFDLQTYFQQYGQLSDCYMPNNGKGIAFVSFVEPEAAHRVLANKEHTVKGYTIQVEQAVDRAPSGKGSAINASAYTLGNAHLQQAQQATLLSNAASQTVAAAIAPQNMAATMAAAQQSFGTLGPQMNLTMTGAPAQPVVPIATPQQTITPAMELQASSAPNGFSPMPPMPIMQAFNLDQMQFSVAPGGPQPNLGTMPLGDMSQCALGGAPAGASMPAFGSVNYGMMGGQQMGTGIRWAPY